MCLGLYSIIYLIAISSSRFVGGFALQMALLAPNLCFSKCPSIRFDHISLQIMGNYTTK